MNDSTQVAMQVALGLACALVGGAGCSGTVENPRHCFNNDGDAYCGREFPDRPFCERGQDMCRTADYGCVATRPTDACYSPCGERATLAEDGSCIDGGSSSSSGDVATESGSGSGSSGETSSGSSTTGPMPCGGDDECMSDAAPFCHPVDGECVACGELDDGDAACEEQDPTTPACVDQDCVQCTAEIVQACGGATPVCDVEANLCVPCFAHEECGEAACNFFTGACLPSEAVVHVGPGQRFATLNDAVDSFGAGGEGTIVVHQADYNEAVTLDGGGTVAFLANEGDVPRWILAGGGSPQLTVGNATVLMDTIQMSGNASTADPALLVDGGSAWVDRGRIVGNDGGGIAAQGGGTVTVRNSFVGGDVSDTDAIAINGATLNLLYTTVGAGFGAATALRCDGASTVTVRNAFVVARTTDDEVQCSAATIDNSATELSLGGTNTSVSAMDTAWFGIDGGTFGGGDFHLSAMAPAGLGNAAEWQEGEPLTDIDGDPRPTTNGSPDYAGADVP